MQKRKCTKFLMFLLLIQINSFLSFLSAQSYVEPTIDFQQTPSEYSLDEKHAEECQAIDDKKEANVQPIINSQQMTPGNTLTVQSIEVEQTSDNEKTISEQSILDSQQLQPENPSMGQLIEEQDSTQKQTSEDSASVALKKSVWKKKVVQFKDSFVKFLSQPQSFVVKNYHIIGIALVIFLLYISFLINVYLISYSPSYSSRPIQKTPIEACILCLVDRGPTTCSIHIGHIVGNLNEIRICSIYRSSLDEWVNDFFDRLKAGLKRDGFDFRFLKGCFDFIRNFFRGPIIRPMQLAILPP